MNHIRKNINLLLKDPLPIMTGIREYFLRSEKESKKCEKRTVNCYKRTLNGDTNNKNPSAFYG